MVSKKIDGTRITVRLLCVEHIDDYLKSFSLTVRSELHVSLLESERVYLHEQLANNKKRESFFYCIFDNSIDKLIGAITIRDKRESSGQLYCWLNEDYWGRGCFQEALGLVAQEYFAVTDERYFTAYVDFTNKRSYHALTKNGFAHAGFHNGPHGKQHVFILRKK